ncbi:MAG: hypothetical protein Q8942_10065 [Bacillota bacterium]|nr:hypothetical protein [Bacillota bacterium]
MIRLYYMLELSDLSIIQPVAKKVFCEGKDGVTGTIPVEGSILQKL